MPVAGAMVSRANVMYGWKLYVNSGPVEQDVSDVVLMCCYATCRYTRGKE